MTKREWLTAGRIVCTEYSDGSVDMAHLKDYYARFWVIEHLSPRGLLRDVLNQHDQEFTRSLANGFGPGILPGQPEYWDWSHVRDSSPGAYRRMADFIAGAWHYRDYDAVYASFLGDLEILSATDPTRTALDFFDDWRNPHPHDAEIIREMANS